MRILGISCHYHDSAACLIDNGNICAAAQEERFRREKYTSVFPRFAIRYCLDHVGISMLDIDAVAFYEKPFLKYARVLESHIESFPYSYLRFMHEMPKWLDTRLVIPLVLKKELGYEGKVLFIPHHYAHAASAYYASEFDESTIVTCDGVGEYETVTIGEAKDQSIELHKALRYPNSLGLVYSAITNYLGFRALSGEGKVMGLAAYGEPVYYDDLCKIIRVNDDGSFAVNESYFGFNKGRRMYSRKFIKKFGKPRLEHEAIEKRHENMAASVQMFLERVLLKIVKHAQESYMSKNLSLAGGVFLNCVANQKIREETTYKNIFIQPAAGDAGGCLGAALYAHNMIYKKPRNIAVKNVYWGPSYSSDEIKTVLVNGEYEYEELDDKKLIERVATYLSEKKIIAWFQGRMEFGPRALCNRSILASPAFPDMKDILNEKVKHRESFRPFGPVVLEKEAEEYFELKNSSPFMLFAPLVKDSVKGKIPAVVHTDARSRLQTVGSEQNRRICELLKEFKKITGVSVLVNTSFNTDKEPIVCTPQDALNTLDRSEIDMLVIGNFIIKKGKK